MALHALIEADPPKSKPKAKRTIGLDGDDTDAEMDAPTALPEGELRVRSRRLQITRSSAQVAHTSLSIHFQLAATPLTAQQPSEKPDQPRPQTEGRKRSHAWNVQPPPSKDAHTEAHRSHHSHWWDQRPSAHINSTAAN